MRQTLSKDLEIKVITLEVIGRFLAAGWNDWSDKEAEIFNEQFWFQGFTQLMRW